MKYEKLNNDQQQQMLDQRLTQYEQEHYNHAVNLALLEASGAEGDQIEAAKKVARDALKTLDDAHKNTKAEIAKLKGTV